jgi:purine catabolism regulator
MAETLLVLPTLDEILALPAFRRAQPRVRTGEPRITTVRWVHSSEVYEIGGLLAGGELLLTTGLGLHGRTPEQLTTYVERLADAGCVALALEVGRSFVDVPDELVRSAERRGLVLLTLHDVTPFEQMIEDFHDLIVARKLASPRDGEPIWQELLGLVLTGQGLGTLLRAVSRLADATAWLFDAEGHVIERSAPVEFDEGLATTAVDVRGPHGSVGRLVLGGARSPHRSSVANRAAVAVGLELARHPDVGQRPSFEQAVINDLVAGLTTSRDEVAERFLEAGWVHVPDRHVLVSAADIDARTPAQEFVGAVREAIREELGPCLVGVTGNTIIAVTRGWVRPEPNRSRAAFVAAFERVRAGRTLRAAGIANPLLDLAEIPAAIAEAQQVVRIARRIGISEGVLLARDVGAHRLVADVPPATVTALVSEQLGPLLSHDVRHNTDLVRTLDAYVGSHSSKAAAAEILGIRRQSLYARLSRVESLLGVRLNDPGQLTSLGLALIAWRMRTGLDPQASAHPSARGA